MISVCFSINTFMHNAVLGMFVVIRRLGHRKRHNNAMNRTEIIVLVYDLLNSIVGV